MRSAVQSAPAWSAVLTAALLPPQMILWIGLGILVISTYTTLSATEDAPVRTEAMGLEHVDREENRINQDLIKIPGACLLELCFPAPPLKKKRYFLKNVVEAGAGSFPGSCAHFPASWGLFPRQAVILPSGKASFELQWYLENLL